MIDCFDEDAVWFALPGNPDYPEPVHGPDAILRLTEEWLEPWDRYEIETLEFEEHGDAVVWMSRHTASQEGSGLTLEVPMSGVFTFRGDRIAEARFFPEKAEALEAVESRRQGS